MLAPAMCRCGCELHVWHTFCMNGMCSAVLSYFVCSKREITFLSDLTDIPY